ncbi:MAG TPA: MMPL family transporter [Mycobacteriales bacterium]|jgi:RND superfamily putative drug exporter|nr:MMPL family transporter [Mycobacteriales bacterium]
MTRLLHRLGSWCAAHPLAVVAMWVAVAGAAVLLAATVGGRLSQGGQAIPGTEVSAADVRLAAHFPAAADTSAVVVLHGADRATVAAAARDVSARIRGLARVVRPSVRTTATSPDGRTALLSVRYDAVRFSLHPADLRRLQAVARSTRGVEGLVSGDLFYQLNVPSNSLAEKVGIGLAVLVLLVAFGSVIAALMPVATAALGIVTGLALVHLLANWYAVNDSAPALATMLGLGAGIDYALFIVTRHREGMRAGLPPAEAAAAAMSSAGTSVVWAGVTVVAAICGLAFGGIPVVTSLGLASAVVVAASVLSALTMLPALLSLTDRHIDRLHIPLPHLRHERVGGRQSAATPESQWSWARWARGIERRPLRYVLGCTVLLVLLAVPVAGMRLGMPDSSSAPRGSDAKRAFTLISDAFGPGVDSPLQLVVELPTGRSAGSGIGGTIAKAVSADPDVAATGPLVTSTDGTTGVMTVTPRSGPQSNATADLVPRLRHHVLPPVERATGARVLVTGLPAGRYDVGQRVLDRLPVFVGAVLALSFLLLMLVFRSILVPLKAVLLNILSIAAALGIVVAVFTWGWLRQLVGVSETVPVVDVVPMIMFAIVFGLSMDYEVFLLSRVREEWIAEGDARGSVVRGLTSTARVISAAAAIMVAVFLAFTLSHDVIVKMVGLGLGVAVFLDATVIRLALVPATMSLLGELNWWLPRWLDRVLPHVDVDAAVPVTPAEPVAGPLG